MATVKVRNIKSVESKIRSRLRILVNKMFRNKPLMNKIGLLIAKSIKDSVYGRASKSWEDRKEVLSQYNKTDPKSDSRVINITFTGAQLNDLATNVKADTTKKQYIIEHSDKIHKGYNLARGGKSKGIPFKEIADNLINKLGYDYLQFDEKTQKIITKIVKDELVRLIKHEF